MNEASRILIVDDEERVRLLLRALIEKDGYECHTASNGVEALSALRENDFSVAVADLYMPELDGMGLLSAIKEAGMEAVVIILTGHGDVSSAVEAMKLGAYDFLSKPIADGAAFRRLIAKAVEHARVLRRSHLMERVAAEWEMTFDASPDLIAVLDKEGRVVRCNQAMAERLGVSKSDLAGVDYRQLIPDYGTTGQQDAITTGQRDPEGHWASGATHTQEIRSDHLGGDFLVTTSPLRQNGADVFGAIYVARDITERKRAEAALRRAHKETEDILAAISSILIGVSADDKVMQWNHVAEEIFNISAADAVGRPFYEVGIPWDWNVVRPLLEECRRKDQPTRLDDIRFTRPDGKEGFMGITVNPIVGNGRPASGCSAVPNGAFLLLGADITQRRILESQLAQAQKLESIGRLAAGIAHEINTPTQYVGDNIRFLQDAFADIITLLGKYDQLLKATKENALTPALIEEVESAAQTADVEYLMEEIPAAIEQSLEGVERVAKIVRAMKEFSHPGVEEKTPIDLNKSIESTITIARNEWKYVADVETDFDPNLPLVTCLPGDLNQVFLNMIVNSAHAIADVVGDGSNGKGTITISTRHVEDPDHRGRDWAEVRIRDTGAGIPPEVISKVFDPFFTTKPVGKGTGQGLAISYNVVVEKHGGAIDVESEVGKGTTFIIRLPITQVN